MSIIVFCLPLLTLLAYKLIAPAMVVLTVILLLRRRSRLAAGFRRHKSIAIIFGALIILTLALSPFSITPRESLFLSLDILALVICILTLLGTVVELPDPGQPIRALACGLAVSTIVFLVDRMSGWPLLGMLPSAKAAVMGGSYYNRGATAAVLFLFPVLAGFWQLGHGHRAAAVALGLLVAVQVALAESSAAQLALVFSLVAVSFVLAFGRTGIRFITLAAALVIVAHPWIVRSMIHAGNWQIVADQPIPASWQYRLCIWSFSADRVMERPLTGWGPDTARAIGKRWGDTECTVVAAAGEPGTKFVGNPIPLHPHNGALQLWLEYGAAGALIGSWLVTLLGFEIGNAGQARWRGFASGQLTAALCIALTAYGLWQMAWLATVAAAAILMRLAAGTRNGAT